MTRPGYITSCTSLPTPSRWPVQATLAGDYAPDIIEESEKMKYRIKFLQPFTDGTIFEDTQKQFSEIEVDQNVYQRVLSSGGEVEMIGKVIPKTTVKKAKPKPKPKVEPKVEEEPTITEDGVDE